MDFRIFGFIMIFVICSYSAWTDYRYGMVYNRFLLIAGGISVITNTVYTMIYFRESLTVYYFSISVGICLALILYFLKIWAGGDCKLMIAVCMSLPIECMESSPLGIGVIAAIYISSFLIAYLFIIADSIRQLVKSKNVSWKDLCRDSMNNFIKYIKIFFVFALIMWIVNNIFRFNTIAANEINSLLAISLTFLIMRNTSILNNKYLISVIVILDFILQAVYFEYFISLRTFVIWILVIMTAFIRNVACNYNYKTVRAAELKKNMILSTVSSVLIKKISNGKIDCISDETMASRLSDETACWIRKEIGEDINLQIVKKIPFATFISMSAGVSVIGYSLL